MVQQVYQPPTMGTQNNYQGGNNYQQGGSHYQGASNYQSSSNYKSMQVPASNSLTPEFRKGAQASRLEETKFIRISPDQQNLTFEWA